MVCINKYFCSIQLNVGYCMKTLQRPCFQLNHNLPQLNGNPTNGNALIISSHKSGEMRSFHFLLFSSSYQQKNKTNRAFWLRTTIKLAPCYLLIFINCFIFFCFVLSKFLLIKLICSAFLQIQFYKCFKSLDNQSLVK